MESEEPDKQAKEVKAVRALLTSAENFFVGTSASLLASSIQMPVLTWKFCTQRGIPMPDTFAGLYRGIGIRLSAVIPLNVTTMIANGLLERIFGASDAKPLSRLQKLICAFLAGCISSPIQSVMDSTIIHQQKLNLGMYATWKVLLRKFGIHALLNGTLATAAREAVGAVGFLMLTPLFADLAKSKLQMNDSSFFGKILMAFVGSFPAAFTSSFITMPVDAAKTICVVDMEKANVRSTWHAIAKIVKESGVTALYKGFPQRTLVLVITMFVIPSVREIAISYKTKKLYGKEQKTDGEQVENGKVTA